MKDTFPNYYPPTDDELSDMWSRGLIVLDANILLDLYRYSPETRRKYLDFLGEISDRLWIPHQAALEYHRNRPAVINDEITRFRDLQRLLGSDLVKSLRSKISSRLKHRDQERQSLLSKLDSLLQSIKRELGESIQGIKHLLEDDPIRDEIADILEGKIGPPYSPERLRQIYEEGETRYQQTVPPGFRDAHKGGARQYGDLILWYQVIDKVAQDQRPVILVTNDTYKGDWYWPQGDTLLPQPELRQEIASTAGVSFHMYPFTEFVESALARLTVERAVDQDAIEEAKDVQEETRRIYRRPSAPATLTTTHAYPRTISPEWLSGEAEWLRRMEARIREFGSQSMPWLRQQAEYARYLESLSANAFLQLDDVRKQQQQLYDVVTSGASMGFARQTGSGQQYRPTDDTPESADDASHSGQDESDHAD